MCPAKIKVFVNKKEQEVDFDLKEAKCEQEINCVENSDGTLKYFLKANKFHSVWSLTFVVTLNYGAENTRFYYIGFEGVNSHKRKTFKLQIPETDKNPTKITQTQEPHINDNLIYG